MQPISRRNACCRCRPDLQSPACTARPTRTCLRRRPHFLRAAGWECDTVFDEALAGAEDARVSERCQVERRVLFTIDLDFADIRMYPPSEYVGIVVFRPATPSRAAVLNLLQSAIPVLAAEWAENTSEFLPSPRAPVKLLARACESVEVMPR